MSCPCQHKDICGPVIHTEGDEELVHVFDDLEKTFTRCYRHENHISNGDEPLPCCSEAFQNAMKEEKMGMEPGNNAAADKSTESNKDKSTAAHGEASCGHRCYRSCERFPWVCVATTAKTACYHGIKTSKYTSNGTTITHQNCKTCEEQNANKSDGKK